MSRKSPTSGMSLTTKGVLLALLALAGIACGTGSGQGAWPVGTVAVVDEIPISAASIDKNIEAILDIEPAFSEGHRRRLILTHSAIPKAFGIAKAGEERARARGEAEAWLASEASGPSPVPADDLGLYDQGHWGDLGLETWLIARDLDPGQSSGIVELSGRFAVIKMVHRDRHYEPGMEFMRVAIASFPYVSSPPSLVSQCLEGTLEIVDPDWAGLIPAKYKYSMRGAE